MMRKLLLLLLCLLLCLAVAACANNAEEPAVGPDPAEELPPDEEWEATPTDLLVGPEFTPDYTDVAEGQQLVSDYADASALIGAELIFPAEFTVNQVLIEGQIVQVLFDYDGSSYLARLAAGLQENMSGITRSLGADEQAEIAGLSVRLRYPKAPEADAAPTLGPAANASMGVADAYDQAANISYMLTLQSDATKDKLSATMEMLINSTRGLYFVPEPEPAPEAATPAG